MAPSSPPTAQCSPSTCPNVQLPPLLPQEYVFLNGEQQLPPSPESVFLDVNQPPLPPQVVTMPFEYVSSLPGKGRRILFTTALNRWLNVSEADVHDTNHVIDILHNVSLMIDDIQDNSSQRRGHPSTHMVFGTAQTINSAMFYINEATSLVQRLCGPEGVQVLLEQMKVLYIGQGYDVNSSQTMRCPTTDEYIRTIDGKTGGLLELNARLLVLKAKPEVNYKVIRRLVVMFGRFYQLRDDYGRSQWHKPEASWCEDLDEGKYTLPVIHLLQSKQDEHIVQNILSTRHMTGKMDELTKRLFLGCLQRAGSMEYTYEILQMVHKDFLLELDWVNTAFGSENQAMRSLIDALQTVCCLSNETFLGALLQHAGSPVYLPVKTPFSPNLSLEKLLHTTIT
ncbi:terpenoid synthase [Xylariaceae sp. AK1471]|nr:terpenoid synthase [Xylariaceae sp. AK1471]